MIRHKPMNKCGARTLKRRRFNVKLKKIWLEAGITSCELRLPGICLGTWALSAAHSKKSRYLITDEDWLEACLADCACHEAIEKMSHEEMHRLVTEAIAKRGTFE